VTTLFLGTDDTDGRTNLSGRDLYPDVLGQAASLEQRSRLERSQMPGAGHMPVAGHPTGRRHPFSFYQRAGFTVVGVIPDANGFGKPDILMAKRVGRAVERGDGTVAGGWNGRAG